MILAITKKKMLFLLENVVLPMRLFTLQNIGTSNISRFISHLISILLQAVNLRSSEILDHPNTQVICNYHACQICIFWRKKKKYGVLISFCFLFSLIYIYIYIFGNPFKPDLQ